MGAGAALVGAGVGGTALDGADGLGRDAGGASDPRAGKLEKVGPEDVPLTASKADLEGCCGRLGRALGGAALDGAPPVLWRLLRTANGS